jgi:hypothetical protein
MGAIGTGIQADLAYPRIDDPCVLNRPGFSGELRV